VQGFVLKAENFISKVESHKNCELGRNREESGRLELYVAEIGTSNKHP
jgi:hypothetical protein